MSRGQLAAADEEGKVLLHWFSAASLAAVALLASAAFAQDYPLAARPYDGIQAGLDAFRLAEERRHASVAGQLALNQQLFFWPASSFGAPVIYSPFGFPLSTYGYVARQPIGQRQEQTGPNRWESHPVYEPPLTPYLPLPPVDSPWLENTVYGPLRVDLPPPPPKHAGSGRRLIDAVEEPVPPPPPKPDPPRSGPREY
jgi:hypothetical protein